ncbi:hypothetical protein [Streptomyces sp. NPDC097610]|uniref:hypothetical protein n=1 Tax=Streptomyces sp. NPDC097610 TaxID=3157227 RepID=UPI0033267598
MTADDAFRRALDAVLRDLRAQCSVQPDVREPEDDYPGLILYAPDGSGQGVYGVGLAEVADGVQDWAVEALWAEGESAVWPPCPAHPDSHPLSATVVEGVAVWVCPKEGEVPVCPIGELPPRDANG